MNYGWEIIEHPTGPWLVKAGGKVFAVPAHLARPLLTRQQGLTSAEASTDGGGPPGVDPCQWSDFIEAMLAVRDGDARTERVAGTRLPPPIWLRVPLLPARWVIGVSRRLVPLASHRGMMTMLMTGLVGYGLLAHATVANPVTLTRQEVAPALAVFLLTAFWHELGHAVAIMRSGYPPGGIGAGLLFVIPVLFADVTAVGVLPKFERVRVDLAGMIFQFGLGGAVALAGVVANHARPLVVGAWLALLAVLWSMMPFIRSDGYWLLCDLMGLTDLESDPVSPPGSLIGGVLVVYRLLNALFLVTVGIVLPARYFDRGLEILVRLGLDLSRLEVLVPAVLVFSIGVGVVWWRILCRVRRLTRSLFAARIRHGD